MKAVRKTGTPKTDKRRKRKCLTRKNTTRMKRMNTMLSQEY
jgi:hypothetical protein